MMVSYRYEQNFSVERTSGKSLDFFLSNLIYTNNQNLFQSISVFELIVYKLYPKPTHNCMKYEYKPDISTATYHHAC